MITFKIDAVPSSPVCRIFLPIVFKTGKIFSKDFRNKDKDSFGKNWIFNWHCLDHVGYKHNPRRRDLGYHKIFDRIEFSKSFRRSDVVP